MHRPEQDLLILYQNIVEHYHLLYVKENLLSVRKLRGFFPLFRIYQLQNALLDVLRDCSLVFFSEDFSHGFTQQLSEVVLEMKQFNLVHGF